MKVKDGESVRGRNVSVDFLRCILMFLIVLHHSAYHGCWKDDTTHWLLPILFTLLIFWHVDGFVAISGWFGTRFSLTRLFSILGVIFFGSIVKGIVVCMIGGEFPSRFDWVAGWYGAAYLSFLFIAPLINAAIEKLAESSGPSIYVVLAIFDVGMILNWLPRIPISLMGGAYSIVTLFCVYVNLRVVKQKGLIAFFYRRVFLYCILFYMLGIVCCSGPYVIKAMIHKGFVSQSDWIGLTLYNSPHSIVMGIAILLYFIKYVRVSQMISGIVNRISPLMFGAYIIHEGSGLGRSLYTIPQKWMIEHTNVNPVGIVIASAVMTFLVCLVGESARRVLVSPLRDVIAPRLKRLDAMLFLTKNVI